jgi:transposase-like protein
MGKHSSGRNGFSFLAPACCPHCGGTEFRKDGIQCGKQRRRCHGCGRTFVPTTGTMLSKTRKRQEKWKRFVVEFTNDATLIASHEYGSINKNTAHLWRLKIMKCLGRLVSETVLSGTVWIDEVYFDVPEKSKTAGENGIFLRGISRNKVCAELAVDSSGRAYACVMGTGKPTSAMILAALRGHVAPGSLIVHDRFHGHGEMLRELNLEGRLLGLPGTGMPPGHADGQPLLRAGEESLRPARGDRERASAGLPGLGLLPPAPEGGSEVKKTRVRSQALRLHRSGLRQAETESEEEIQDNSPQHI